MAPAQEGPEAESAESVRAGGPSAIEAVFRRRPALATLALLVAVGFAVFGDFLFGERLYLFKDVGGDGLTLFYPRFVHLADYLRSEGLPGWSFRQGLGQDVRPFALGDPFAWILYAVGRDHIPHAFAVMELAKLVAAGAFFGAALRTARFGALASASGAVAYAFSGYMVVGSGWTVFSSYGVQLALLLLGFERYWMRGDRAVFPIAVAAIAAFNPTSFAPFAAIGSAWAVLRIGESRWRGGSAVARAAGELLGLAVLGLLLSAWLSIGIFLNLAESPRGTGEASHAENFAAARPLHAVDAEQAATAVARTFSSDLLGNGDDFAGWYNYLEAPLFYCGTATLVLFGLACALPDRRRRRWYLALAAVAMLPTLFPFLRYAVWFFTGNYYRHLSLLWVLMLLVPALRAFDALRAGWRPAPAQIAAAAGAPLAIFAALFATGAAVDAGVAAAVAACLLAHAVLVWLAARSGRRARALALVAVAVCFEAVAFARISVGRRDALTRAELTERVGYNDLSLEAIERARSIEPRFHRIEKNYGSAPTGPRSYNDAKVQRYFGTTSYYSFNQIHAIRFLVAFGFVDPEFEPDTRWMDGVNRAPGPGGLLSVRFLLMRDLADPVATAGLREVARYGDIALYENRLFVPFGATYDRVISEDALLALDVRGRRVTLTRAATLDPDEAPEAFAALPSITRAEVAAADAGYGLAAALADAERLSREAVRWDSITHNELRGRIDLTSAKLVFLSIPFDEGWRAEVNGAPAKLLRANVGFMGLLLPAGRFEIALRFEPRHGHAAAIVSLVAMACYAWLIRRARVAAPAESEPEVAHPDSTGADEPAGDRVTVPRGR